MNRKLISYWIATGVVCLVFTGGGIANLFHADTQREIMEKLGYPAYLMTLLGVAKLLASPATCPKADISTWQRIGHFYLALTMPRAI